MPFKDGTGPLGEGPATGRGRGRGPCAGARTGSGLGRGAGRRNRFGQPQGGSSNLDQKSDLERRAGFLQSQLERIKRQLAELSGGGKDLG